MAKEVLAVPERYLADVIRVIRAGLTVCNDVPEVVRENLNDWCDSEEVYLAKIQEGSNATEQH